MKHFTVYVVNHPIVLNILWTLVFKISIPFTSKKLPLNSTLNHLILNKLLGLKCTPIRFCFADNNKRNSNSTHWLTMPRMRLVKSAFNLLYIIDIPANNVFKVVNYYSRFPVTQEFKPLADYESRLNIYFCSLKNESIVRVRHTFWKCDKAPSWIIF